MRNYWVRIALGAVVIFAVGMIGVSLARQGVGHVRGVVEGSGPLSIPLAFVPFKLDGEKLGTVSRVVLMRDAPKQISAIELQIKLRDSVIARGLAGCHLTTNFDDNRGPSGTAVDARQFTPGVFTCVRAGDSAPGFQEFGRAVFQPGDVSVPLLLPNDMVNDLQHGEFDESSEDSIGAAAQATADSISDAVEARTDSIEAAAEMRADSIVARSERLVDSLRKEGMRRADSTRRMADQNSEPNPAR
jgi:hypothetical protein